MVKPNKKKRTTRRLKRLTKQNYDKSRAVKAEPKVLTEAEKEAKRVAERERVMNKPPRVLTEAEKEAKRVAERERALKTGPRVLTEAERGAKCVAERGRRKTRSMTEAERRAKREAERERLLNEPLTEAEREEQRMEARKRKEERARREKLSTGIKATDEYERLTDETKFFNTDHDPEQALLLYCANSGAYQFQHVNELDSKDPSVRKKAIEKTKSSLLACKLQEDAQHALLDGFYDMMGRGGFGVGGGDVAAPDCDTAGSIYDGGPRKEDDARHYDQPILTCACCGIQNMSRDDWHYRPVNSCDHSEIFALFELTALEQQYYDSFRGRQIVVPTDDHGGRKTIDLQQAFSVLEHKSHCYWLHEDYVQSNEGGLTMFLCPNCCTAMSGGEPSRPEHCLAHVNFGAFRKLGLEKPTMLERMMCSKARHHHCLVKIQSNGRAREDHQQSKIIGSCTLFEHNASLVSAWALSNPNESRVSIVDSQMKLHFIGPKNQMDVLMKNTAGTSIVSGRPFVMYQLLAVLQALHEDYQNDPPLPPLDECLPILRQESEAVENHLLTTALKTFDRDVVRAEDAIGDDVGDPFRSVPTLEENFGDLCQLELSDDTHPDCNPPGKIPDLWKEGCQLEVSDGGMEQQASKFAKTFGVSARRDGVECSFLPKQAAEVNDNIQVPRKSSIQVVEPKQGFQAKPSHCSNLENNGLEPRKRRGTGETSDVIVETVCEEQPTVAKQTMEGAVWLFPSQDPVNNASGHLNDTKGSDNRQGACTGTSDVIVETVHEEQPTPCKQTIDGAVWLFASQDPENNTIKCQNDSEGSGNRQGPWKESDRVPRSAVSNSTCCCNGTEGSDNGQGPWRECDRVPWSVKSPWDSAGVKDSASLLDGVSEHQWQAAEMRYTFLQPRDVDGSVAESTQLTEQLMGVADALNIPVVEHQFAAKPKATVDEVLQSSRSGVKLNEFELGDKCMVMAFPDIFLFGKAYGKKSGTLTKNQRLHLLQQFDRRASTNKDLLTFLFSQQIRHGNVGRMSQYVKGHPDILNRLTKLRKLPEFEERLNRAIDNPTKEDAKWVLQHINPLLSAGQKGAQYGALERKQNMAKTKALSRFFGSGGVFFTMAPPDENNPTTLRLALYSDNNTKYPAQSDDTAMDELKTNVWTPESSTLLGEASVELPHAFNQRVSRTIADPVATVIEYRQLISALLSVMFKIKPSFSSHRRHSNRTYFCGGRGKGVYGTTLSVMGVNEAQARGKLHFHCILWGGIPPEVLQAVSHIDSLAAAAQEALDSMFKASLPLKYHARHIVEQHMRRSRLWKGRLESRVPHMFSASPSPRGSDGASAEFWDRCHSCASVYNIHEHSFTCHKGKAGEHYCRMCYDRACVDKTGAVELSEELDDTDVPFSGPVTPPQNYIPTLDSPFPPATKRLVAWEVERPLMTIPELELSNQASLQRGNPFRDNTAPKTILRSEFIAWIRSLLGDKFPGMIESFLDATSDGQLERIVDDLKATLPTANGRVVEYTPLLMAAIPGNHAAYCLGTSDQSNACLLYLSSYVAKTKMAVAQVLSTFQQAARDVKLPQYRSVADDAGSDFRTSLQILHRTLNKLDNAMEFSDTQMAASLLGFPTEITTDIFSYFSPHQALSYTLHRQGKIAAPVKTRAGSKRSATNSTSPTSCTKALKTTLGQSASLLARKRKAAPTVLAPSASATASASGEAPGSENPCAPGHGEGGPATNGSAAGPPDGTIDSELDIPEAEEPYEETCILDNHIDIEPMDEEHTDLGRYGFYNQFCDKQIDVGGGLTVTQKNCKQSVLVNYNDHWQFRGEELRHFSRVEYAALIKVIPLEPVSPGTEQKSGKSPNRTFRFAKSHPLHASHVQRLRTKHTVPIFLGRDPIFPGGNRPEHPLRAKKWDERREKFGAFFVHTYRPEPDNYDGETANNREYSWKELCSYLEELRTDRSVLSQLRLAILNRAMNNSATSQNKQDRMTAFRGRAKTYWSTDEKNRYSSYMGQQKQRMNTGDDCEIVTGSPWALSQKQALLDCTLTKHREDQAAALDSVFGSTQSACAAASGKDQVQDQRKWGSPVVTVDPSTVDATMAELQSAKRAKKSGAGDDTVPSQYAPHWSHNAAQAYFENIPVDQTPNREQQALLEVAVQHFTVVNAERVRGEMYSSTTSPKLVVLGGPGAGKTTTVNHLPKLAKAMKAGTVLRFSYPGITSVLAGGATYSSTFYPGKSGEAKITQLVRKSKQILQTRYEWENVVAIILDEISTFSPLYLAIIDHRLREVTNQDRPFGGIMIWLVGDFMQSKAIRQKYFFTGMLEVATETEPASETAKLSRDFALGTTSRKGIHLFSDFRCHKLTSHNRIKDSALCSLIDRMHNGQSMEVEDLHRIKILSEEDIKSDPSWRFAPILVPTNRERFDLTASQAVRYAASKGIPVVRWRRKVKFWDNAPATEADRRKIIDEDPVFWQYCVISAGGYINSNIEVTHAKCANGTPILIHSFTFATDAIATWFTWKYSTAKPGEVITLLGNNVPYSVNVIPWPNRADRELQEASAPYSILQTLITPGDNSPTETVIALTSTCFTPKFDSNTPRTDANGRELKRGIPLASGMGYDASRIGAVDILPIELDFVMTVDKSLGRTLEKVVLALHPGPNVSLTDFHKFLVVISRTEGFEFMRFLGHRGCTISAFEYLCRLKPDPKVLQFLHGYDAPGGLWNATLALQKKGEMEVARSCELQQQKRQRALEIARRKAQQKKQRTSQMVAVFENLANPMGSNPFQNSPCT